MQLTLDDFETWKIVGLVGVKYQTDVDMHREFFNHMLSRYTGGHTKEALIAWLDEQVARSFQALAERPVWIQNPQWAFDDEGQPMRFVKQFEIGDTVFYVFVPQESWTDDDIKVVTQWY